MTIKIVYRATKPPIDGGKEWFPVNSTQTAIKKVKQLNAKSKKKDWVYA